MLQTAGARVACGRRLGARIPVRRRRRRSDPLDASRLRRRLVRPVRGSARHPRVRQLGPHGHATRATPDGAAHRRRRRRAPVARRPRRRRDLERRTLGRRSATTSRTASSSTTTRLLGGAEAAAGRASCAASGIRTGCGSQPATSASSSPTPAHRTCTSSRPPSEGLARRLVPGRRPSPSWTTRPSSRGHRSPAGRRSEGPRPRSSDEHPARHLGGDAALVLRRRSDRRAALGDRAATRTRSSATSCMRWAAAAKHKAGSHLAAELAATAESADRAGGGARGDQGDEDLAAHRAGARRLRGDPSPGGRSALARRREALEHLFERHGVRHVLGRGPPPQALPGRRRSRPVLRTGAESSPAASCVRAISSISATYRQALADARASVAPTRSGRQGRSRPGRQAPARRRRAPGPPKRLRENRNAALVDRRGAHLHCRSPADGVTDDDPLDALERQCGQLGRSLAGEVDRGRARLFRAVVRRSSRSRSGHPRPRGSRRSPPWSRARRRSGRRTGTRRGRAVRGEPPPTARASPGGTTESTMSTSPRSARKVVRRPRAALPPQASASARCDRRARRRRARRHSGGERRARCPSLLRR